MTSRQSSFQTLFWVNFDTSVPNINSIASVVLEKKIFKQKPPNPRWRPEVSQMFDILDPYALWEYGGNLLAKFQFPSYYGFLWRRDKKTAEQE